jgi:hypothetical protein
LFHLAYCREQQGEWVDALAAYERAKELIDAGMTAPDLQPLLDSALNGLRVRMPRVRIAPNQTTAECDLRIDGKTQSSVLTHQAIPLDPGKHRLELQCSGYTPFSRDIELVAGEAPNLAVRLTPVAKQDLPGPLPMAGVSSSSPEPHAASAPKTADSAAVGPTAAGVSSAETSGFTAKHAVILTTGALAVAGVVGGIVFHHKAGLDYRRIGEMQRTVAETLPEACAMNPSQAGCLQISQLESNYRAERTLEVVSFAVGGASGIAALLTGLLAGGNEKVVPNRAQRGPSPRVSATMFGHPKLMLWLQGSW